MNEPYEYHKWLNQHKDEQGQISDQSILIQYAEAQNQFFSDMNSHGALSVFKTSHEYVQYYLYSTRDKSSEC